MVLIHSNYARDLVFEDQKESYSLIFGKEDYLEKSLFEFSNKMGAFILSLMIYWMNPKNYDNRISIEESIQIVLRIIQNTVTEMMNPNKNNTIYNSFSKLVYNNYENKHNNDGKDPYNYSIPFDVDFHREITSAFSDMYPKFWLEFNKLSDSFYFQKDLLRKKTSSIGQALIQDMDHIQLLNKQSICNHEFVEINNKKVYKRKMVECIKCNLFITKSKANDMKSILKSKNKNS